MLFRSVLLLSISGINKLASAPTTAVAAGLQPLIVVVGADASLLIPEIDNNNTQLVINTNWKDGMATSIITGLSALLEKYPAMDSAIFMTCDQPFVTAALLNDLIITHQQTGKSIVASIYDSVMGVPALFYKSHFDELLQLQGDTGARKIIQQHINDVATVPFVKGKIDIDTPEDYENLLKETK